MSDDDDLEIVENAEPDSEPDNAASERQVERKEKRLARHKREEEKFWREVFASEIGRRAMWQILQVGHLTEVRFACGPNGFPQSEATWFEAGKQEMARLLHDSWDVLDHEGVYVMRCENDPRFARAKLPRKKAEA